MKKRGSITLEAAVVMPIVLAVSIVMVYFLLVHYERVVLSAFCSEYAEAIAKYSNAKYTKESEVNNTDKYFYQDKISWKKDLKTEKFRYPAYWRIFNDYLPTETSLLEKLKSKMIFRHNIKVEVKKETDFLSSYIIVSGHKRVYEIVPILKTMGIYSKGILITSVAKAPVSDRPELIRNMNLIMDAVRLIPGAGETLDKLKSGLKETMEKLLN